MQHLPGVDLADRRDDLRLDQVENPRLVPGFAGAEQPLLNSELLGYGRDPLAPIRNAVTADSDVVVPLDAEAFGFWRKAAFGAPATTGAEAPCSREF